MINFESKETKITLSGTLDDWLVLRDMISDWLFIKQENINITENVNKTEKRISDELITMIDNMEANLLP
jgi:hypothetical protein